MLTQAYVGIPLIDTLCIFELGLFFFQLNTFVNPKHIKCQLIIHHKHYKHYIFFFKSIALVKVLLRIDYNLSACLLYDVIK